MDDQATLPRPGLDTLRPPMAETRLTGRIRRAESDLFAASQVDVDELFLDLPRTGLRLRVLAHGEGAPLVLLHGVAMSSAVWGPLFGVLPGFRMLAVDLPGHGLSDPVAYRRGEVRNHATLLIDDIMDALGLDRAPVVGHSLGAMFALWHLASGAERISGLVALGAPAVALPGVRVRMPLSLLTVRGLGVAVQRSPGPRRLYRQLLAHGLGSAEVDAAPDALVDALRLSARRPENAATVGSLMHAIDRFRRPRAESVLTSAELAGISAPTTFVLGSRDPYISVDLAARSIQQIPDATVHEVPAGHAPWLVSPRRAAELIADHEVTR
jgi:pimeloyl-ACP methyl ester carboxylesterase